MAELEQVYVHIGPLKTGTTYVQQMLGGNRDVLAEQSAIFPGEDFRQHARAVQHLLGRRRGIDGGKSVETDQWTRLVEEVRASGVRSAVVSMEYLASADPDAVHRMVSSLAPTPVRIVFTARDYSRLVPAAWQTALRSQHAPTWPEFLASVQDPEGVDGVWGRRFWRQQDPAQVLAPYLEHVPAEQVSIVTMPPSADPPDLLWRRFCTATGLRAEAFDLGAVRRFNLSLGAVEAEVLRRLNLEVAGRIPGGVYSDLVKVFVAREVLERRPQSFRLGLAADEYDWLDKWVIEQRAYLAGSGFTVVGDLDDLVPLRRPLERRPDSVTEPEVAAVLAEVLGATVREMARRQSLQRWEGPRSAEEPLPEPAELGLSGRPPRPGERLGGRVQYRAERSEDRDA